MKHYGDICGLSGADMEPVDCIKAERGNKYQAASMKRKAEGIIEICAKEQLKGISFDRSVSMTYLWVEPNRKRDKDNIAFAKKFIQDALVSAGVLQGDGWKHIEGFTDFFEVDSESPRIEIFIEGR